MAFGDSGQIVSKDGWIGILTKTNDVANASEKKKQIGSLNEQNAGRIKIQKEILFENE